MSDEIVDKASWSDDMWRVVWARIAARREWRRKRRERRAQRRRELIENYSRFVE